MRLLFPVRYRAGASAARRLTPARGRRTIYALVLMLALVCPPAPKAQAPDAQMPTFRSAVDLVLVDVVVRDRNGEIVRGLTADDFQLIEDGKPQQIVSFSFDEIVRNAAPMADASLLAGATVAAPATITGTRPAVSPPTPMSAEALAGRRLMILLFDTSSMQPEDVQQAIDSAMTWTADSMTPADLVAVATISNSLHVLTDFTGDRSRVQQALAALSAADGTGTTVVDSSTAATDDAAAAAASDTTTPDASAQELDTFNNDVRLRALTALAQALTPIQQKKAILYFSAGMERSGADNQVELRKAINAAVRANVSIYPVDARGLQAMVPGGSARSASRGGVGAFSGQAVAQQFSQFAAQQDTLQTLAADTGGTAFTDTNNFGDAFARVAKDISAYYILGFSSSNQVKDGRFRRISVRLKNRAGMKLEAREGYYADRDFAHTAKTDREVLLQEQLAAALPATDVPVFLSSGWFRLSADRYYVPLSVAIPGQAIPRAADKTTLDVAGVIRDERGAPVGRIRDTLTLPAAAPGSEPPAAQVLYQTGVTLPPGRFTARVVVRENVNGDMGSFESQVVVPELKTADIKVSSVVLSTQLQASPARKTNNPLVRDGVELVPNLTHIVGRDQKMYVYYEVYEPAVDAGVPQVATNLTFYRGGVKVFETPHVERSQIDAADRKASLFQFEVPANSLAPGFYTCQINVVDQVAAKFAFPRFDLYIR